MAWNSSFNAMVAADFADSFLNQAEFGTTIVIVQRDTKPRTINCQIVEGTETVVDNTHHESIVSVIHVFATDDPVIGIVGPQIGDYVEWNGGVYSFLSVACADTGARKVTFQKQQITQFGANRPPSL